MKHIPSDIRELYDAHLNNKAIPKTAHFYYKKWLRYYLDFCSKYRYQQLNKESLNYFIKKLKEKKQNDQQLKQAFHAISLYYELGSINYGKEKSFKNKNEKLSTKKESLRLTNANWVPVYNKLTAEIKLERINRINRIFEKWFYYNQVNHVILSKKNFLYI